MKHYLTFFGCVLVLGLAPVLADQVVTDQVDDEVIIGPPSHDFVNVVDDLTMRALFYSNSRNLADPYKITRPGGHCGTNGSATDLQTALGLINYGYNCNLAANMAVADDFVLCGQATIQQIAFYVYQTGATSPTINRIDYAILSTDPEGQPQPTWTTVTAPPVSFVTVYKKMDTDAPTAGCTRRIQKVIITLSPPVTLNAGRYWLAWRVGGSATYSGPWHPPVVFLGLTNKPGANALQSNAGAAFAPVLDGTYPQDFVFELYGTAPAWPTGACCLLTGVCVPDTTECECMLSLDGTWQGPGTGCDPNPCEVFIGACCFLDGSCELQFPADCMAAYGDYLGPNTTCDPNLCPPPCIQCPPGAVPEGEPPCFNGYVDTFNGGCNSTPPVFSPIACGQTVCGTGGNFLVGGGQTRDTDWYELVTTNPRIFTWTATATFPVLIFVIQAGPEPTPCTGYTVLNPAGTMAPACQPASFTTPCMPPGKYWFWVGTQGFAGVPCNSPYVATLTCAACPPFGACCYPEGYCEELPESDCYYGIWLGEGVTCDSNMCEPCGFCGPWQHFIDTCVGGDDYLPSHALVGIDTTLDCVADTNLIMSGPVKVHRSNPHPGTPPDPNDPTHANVIDTEILTMHLTSGGVILTAGAGQGHGGALAASLGQIAESPADPARGESFFDVFFEVDLGGGTYVYNQTALRIQTPVTCIPPFHEYIHVQNCVWLWTSPTPGQGTHVANLVAPNHDAYPFGACCFPDGSCQTTTTEYACAEAGGIFKGPGTTCHPNPCTCQHQIDLWDCYGDGWNGNTLDVKVNGNLVLSGITLASGYGPATYYFMAATGDTIQTIYHPIGGWPYEPYYYIYDGVGNLLGSDGISGTNCWVQPTGITVTGNCAPLPLGACCFADAHCEDLTQLDCANAGGTWGQGQQCSLNPCGACCAPGECGESTEFDCTMAGADWMGAGTTCDPNPCVGACCYPEGYCEVTPQEQCTGIWLGGGTTCSPNMCEPCADCGPWPHFIDTCAAGNDYLPSAALVGIDTDLDPDCTADINLIMHGPVKVHRSAPLDDSVNFPGTRPLDGHLDVIDTEILMMHLTGLGGIVLTAGGGQGQGAVLAPSLGRIAEYYSDPAVGDSFFDVFFEVDLGGGNYAYNHTALKVQTRVTCIPPYQEYIHVLDCIELYDSPTGGTHIANLVAPIHDAYPFGACCFPDGSCQTTTTEWACQAAGGEFQGFGTLCHPNPCPQPLGACCYPDGSCTIVPENQCSGIWLGEGTSCIHCEPCAFCGPGPHFIDTCAGGDDALPSSALVGIDTTLNCVPETSLVMFGPVKVHRGNPYAGPPPNDPNHPNRIDTEIVSMHLTGGGGGGGGVILIAGAGLGQGGVLAASLGRMTELPSNPAMADSFFDVFFEVDLGGGNYVYNQTALRVQTLITCIPPYHEYIHVQNCVQLWTSPTVGQGIHVANLVAPDHDAYPFGGACCFPDGSCQTTSVDICQMAGGEWKGAGTTCHPNPCICLGDVNCDGVVNFGDINPFVLFLSNFPLWQQTYQGCPWQNGDINGDGTYGTGSFGDINPFVALIVQSPILCP